MKKIVSILFFISLTAKSYGALCLCQYPTEYSKLGSGYAEEIPLYKLGCKLWLITQKDCRARKTIKIQDSFSGLINQSNELIKMGFVGHWSGSIETTKFLNQKIKDLAQQGISFEIDNTACSPMEDPELVLKTLKRFSLKKSYIRIKGSQATSIGMWDQLTPFLASADVYAVADSRKNGALYPYCDRHQNKPCLKDQANESANCISDGRLKTITCKRSSLSSRLYLWQ